MISIRYTQTQMKAEKTKRVKTKLTVAASTVVVALLVLYFIGDASAADLAAPTQEFQGLLDSIKNAAGKWNGQLRGYATTVFWTLATIQFVWTFIPMVFKQADIGELVGELARFILVIGFFYALLLFSAEWANALVQSFREAGASASGAGAAPLNPGDVYFLAIDLAKTVSSVAWIKPTTGLVIALAGMLVMLSFAFIAAFMALTLIESYVVINASVLFMGFGGSQWTREYALAIVRYAVAVGAKLFTLTLIVTLIVDAAKDWQRAYTYTDSNMWTMVGLAFTCAYLAKTIPELIAGMISGSSMGGGHHIGGMAAAAAAGAAAGIAAVSTGGASLAAGTAMKAAGTAAGSTATGGATGGGLAQLINQSLMGGPGAPGAAAAGGSAGANPAASMPTPRIGGGGPGVSVAPPSQGAGSAPGAPAGSAKPASASSAPAGGSSASGLAARGAVRAAGVMASMSVPGMESAAGLSIGPPPPGAPGGGADGDAGDGDLPYAAVPESRPAENNFIRPAAPAPEREPPPAPKA